MTFPPFATGDSGNPFTRSSPPSDSERRVVFAYPNFGVASQPSPSSFSFGPQPGSSQFPQHTAHGPPSGNSTCFPFPPQTSPFFSSSSPSFQHSNSAPNTLGYTSTSSFGTVFGSSVASSSPASVFPSFPSATSAAPAFGFGSNESGFGKNSFSFGYGADHTHSYPSLEKISDNSAYGQKPAFGFSFSPSFHTNNSVNSSYASLFKSDNENPTLAAQQRGSRITPYAVTEMINESPAKMASICGMPVYGAKSHEELRWEDYQLRTEVGRAIVGGSTHPCFGMSKGSTSDESGFFPSSVSNTPTWGPNWGVSQPFLLHIGSSADSASVDPFGEKPITNFSFPPPTQANTSGVNGAGSLNWIPHPPFPSPSNVQTPTCPPFPFNAPNAYPLTQPNTTASMPDPSTNTSTFLLKEPSQSAPTESTNPAVNSSYASLFRSDNENPTLAAQQRGSRIIPYAVTEMINESPAKMASICGMPVYGAKSHEELRWEDYQLRTEVGRAIVDGSTHPWFGISKGSTSDESGFFPSSVSNTPTWGPNWGVSQPFPLHIGPSADSASVDPFGKKPITNFSFPPPSQANTSGLNWKPNPPFPSLSNVQTPTCPSPFPFNTPNSPHTPPSWLPLPSSSPSTPLNQSTFSEQQPAGKVCPKCHSSVTSEYTYAYPLPQPNPTASMPDPSTNTSTFLLKEPSQSAPTESTNPAAVESLANAMADNIVAVKDPFGAQPSKQLSSSSTQFGISSMPMQHQAIHIPLLIKTSPLHAPRHISQRRGTLHLSIQQQRSDQEKVPFFVHENDPEGIRVPLNHLAPRRDPKSAFMSISEPTAESSTGITFDLNSESADPISKMVGEFHITLEEEPVAPKLTRPGYYTEPSISELQAKENSDPGFCSRVRGFAVGRHGFGKIKFEGETDVTGLDLDSTVEFNAREVVVYPDPTKRPGAGEGLNKAAVVTLMEVKCVNKKTGEVYVEGEAVEKYVGMLKKAGEKQGAEFVSYDAAKGEWKFRVQHF